MTQTYFIQGRSSSLLGNVARTLLLAAVVVGGLLLLAFFAAFAFVAIAVIAVLAFLVVGFFWAKAKLTGKPFGPRAHFEQMRKEMEAQLGQPVPGEGFRPQPKGQGPVVDLHRTPDGWSVDD